MKKQIRTVMLFSPEGERLYLTAQERRQFLIFSKKLKHEKQNLFCQVLYETGARLAEVLALTGRSVNVQEKTITIKNFKIRALAHDGNVKESVFRQIPVTSNLIKSLACLYDLKSIIPLWSAQKDPLRCMPNVTGWRIVRSALKKAGIEGPQATPTAIRHGLAVEMIEKGMDIETLQYMMGHEKKETTNRYFYQMNQNR